MTRQRFREMTQLMEKCEKQGCVVTLTNKNHFKIVTPSGQLVVTGGTPSDRRSLMNARAQLRRAGVKL